MTSTLTRPPDVTTPSSKRTIASRRDDTIGALGALALIVGVLTDAWAHANRLSTLEGFFTPWHALLYGGFAATAAWTWWLAFRHRREDPRWFLNRWPVGYGIGAIGSLVFLVGGAGDMFWHEIFGVEVSLEAGLSPSHVTLTIGVILLITSQMRSWLASGEGGWRTVTGVASTALGTIGGLLIINGLIGVTTIAPTRAFDPAMGAPSYTSAAQGVQAYLLGAALLLIPFLLVQRRRGAPGLATAIVGSLGLFLLIQREFPTPLTGAIVGMTLAAAVVDVVLSRLDTVRGLQAPMRLPIAGALFAGGIWTGHLIGLQIASGIRWSPELWAGAVVLSAVIGALLGTLAASKPADKPADEPTQVSV
ncbi:MAG TPA: hypothetical protein VFC19_27790 [Candidatus Limnocylindrales bacterium]|nr:hypothetical protein [Candidatus Limnocylindrales bacterium]